MSQKRQSSTATKTKKPATQQKQKKNSAEANSMDNENITVELAPETITELLHQDHLRVEDMLFRFCDLEDEEEKKELVDQILQELYMHSVVEEEIVYPRVREESLQQEVEKMVDEAETEHHLVKVLMAEIAGMRASDEQYSAKVSILAELVRHHVREEEKYMFEKMRASGMNLEELIGEVLERKEELYAEYTPESLQEIWQELKGFDLASSKR